MAGTSYPSLQKLTSATSELGAIEFVVTSILNRIATATLVKVLAVSNDGGVSPIGTVSVQPLVNQVDGAGAAMPHGQISDLPYFRLQGGANAVIIDPQVGDIGAAIFCMRDISSVKRAGQQSNPGSFRKFDWADGLYLGSFLGAAPSQYLRFSSDGIEIVSPNAVNVTATNGISLTAPTLTIHGNLQVDGNINATGTISP